MEFLITRTSISIDSKKKPHEKAYKKLAPIIETRNVDCPTKLTERARQFWYSSGRNHRVEEGQLVKDLGEEERWFIELNSLEELVDFYEAEGELIITDHPFNKVKGCKVIEIYDYYRE